MIKKETTKQWLIKKHRFLKRPLILLIFMSAILSATAVMFAYLSKLTLDAAEARLGSQFVYAAILLLLLLVFQIIFRGLYSYLIGVYKARTDKQIKTYVYRDILHKKQPSLDQYHTGQLMNYLDSDVTRIVEGLVDIIPRFIFLILRFLFAFILLFILDMFFAFVMLGFGSVLLVASVFLRNEMKKRHNAMQDQEARLRSYMQENLEHIMLIKSFEAENYTLNKLDTTQTGFLNARIHKHKLSVLASIGLAGFFTFGYALAIIYGGYRIGTNALTFGSLIAILQLVEFMQSPFSGLSQLLPKYYAMLASSERIIALENEPLETKDPNLHLTTFNSVDFEEVSFKYDESYILEHFTESIKQGEFIHIRGDSGIGKTTLLKLLLGLIEPEQGTLTVTHNEETHTISESTRSLFTYVPQGLMLLSGTIRDNIIYNQKDVDEDTLIKVTQIAHIYDEIMKLPKGFDTFIGERGYGLSEGQIQRLAIARALLKNSPIMLLDEITSALDQNTEEAVLKNIKTLTDKTCLIISHRPLNEEYIDTVIKL